MKRGAQILKARLHSLADFLKTWLGLSAPDGDFNEPRKTARLHW